MAYERIESLQHEKRVHEPGLEFVKHAHLSSLADYDVLYQQSLADPHAFWLAQAHRLSWEVFPQKSLESRWDSAAGAITHTWFADGRLNVAANCLDRHLKTQTADTTALLWQGEDLADVRQMTYRDLHARVCQFANVLKAQGVGVGDRVCLYLPMIPEAVVAMLACARLGAIHSVVFGGFSVSSLAMRIADAGCKIVVTADQARRGGKAIGLKAIVDEALTQQTTAVQKVIVVRHTGGPVAMQAGRDLYWHEAVREVGCDHEAVSLNVEDPLFILYTSGSTGKPKGVLHTQAGYLLYANMTFQFYFDYHPGQVYWCTADVGWITGHTYAVYGPLSAGATVLMYEGVPSYPDYGRFWQIVEKHRVNIFYTAPTAIRAMMRAGEAWPRKFDLSSLRLLGSVGEPINPEAWHWYYENVGGKRCPIVDTWWQTETGGIMISTLPGAQAMRPGSAGRPFFGVDPVILRDDGTECPPGEGGQLCFKRPWPGLMRTTWGDPARFVKTYFTQFPNLYTAGDVCQKDEDGYFWFLGRSDDVVKVSGHRIGAAEVESALVSDHRVAEAAVVGAPHAIKGESLHAFVILKEGVGADANLAQEMKAHVAAQIGPVARPDVIQFVSGLPKTRSGKIMRRILKKIAAGDIQNLGDTSTLAEPQIVADLVQAQRQLQNAPH